MRAELRHGLSQRGRPLVAAVVVVAIYAAVLAFALLNPSAGPASSSVWLVRDAMTALGLPSVLGGLVEPAMNMLIFVPLPFLVALLGRTAGLPTWFLVGLGVSTAVELVQLVVLSDRTPSGVDVLTNTAGVVLGAVALRLWRGHHAHDTAGRVPSPRRTHRDES